MAISQAAIKKVQLDLRGFAGFHGVRRKLDLRRRYRSATDARIGPQAMAVDPARAGNRAVKQVPLSADELTWRTPPCAFTICEQI